MLNKRFQIILGIAIVLLVVAMVYMPAVHFDFTNWDDDAYITQLKSIRSLSFQNIVAIFSSAVFKVYSPLTILTFAVEYHFVEYNPFIYHLNNILLHLGVLVGIIYLFKELKFPLYVCCLTALIFGLHPMHVESVVWVTERKDVLYALFYVWSIVFYGRYSREENKQRNYVLSLVFGLLSMLSKPMALSLPLILWIYDWFSQRKFDQKLLLDKIPFFAFIVPIAWLTYSLHQRLIQINWSESFFVWVWTYGFYIYKFFLPIDFRPLYQLPRPISALSLNYIVPLIIFISSCGIVFCLRKYRVLTFSIIFYFASIFFLLRFDDIMDLSFVADRFMYLPSLGFCLLVALVISKVTDYLRNNNLLFKIIRLLLPGVLTVFLFMQTSTTLMNWQNSLVLWNFMLSKDSKNGMAFYNRGRYYVQNSKFKEAFEDFDQSIKINPYYSHSLNDRGVLHWRFGDKEEALKDFNRSLTLHVQFEPLINRGTYFYKKGDLKSALKDFDHAMEFDSNHKDLLNNRGNLLLQLDQPQKAFESFEKAVALDPLYSDGFNGMAVSCMKLNRWEDALRFSHKAIELNPRFYKAFSNRGFVYLHLGDVENSLKDFMTSLRLKPDYLNAFKGILMVNDFKKAGQKPIASDVGVKQFDASEENNEIDKFSLIGK